MPRKIAAKNKNQGIVPAAPAERLIHLVRGQRVILGADLALLYGVPTKAFNQQIRRNPDRFPPDFMFQLTWDEVELLRSQIVTLALQRNPQPSDSKQVMADSLRSQNVTLNDPQSSGRGQHLKYRPFAFTEHGAIMAATVLNSPQAVAASLFVVRAFVRLREMLATQSEQSVRLDEHDRRLDLHEGQIHSLIDAFNHYNTLPEEPDPPRKPIGFHAEWEDDSKTAKSKVHSKSRKRS